jgi:Ca2+-binding RTX toxin-like protein
MAIVTANGVWYGEYYGGYLMYGEDLTDLYLWSPRTPQTREAASSLYTIETANNGFGTAVNAFIGTDLVFDAAQNLSGGTITGWAQTVRDSLDAETTLFSFARLAVPATTLAAWIDSGVNTAPLLLAGNDSITGTAASDILWGYAGNDTIDGNGAGTFYEDEHDELRGGDGNDVIRGGGQIDDINGNRGDDTATGGAGNDLLHGGQGDDYLNGNVGNDTLYGDLGSDTVRGGQDDDVIYAGSGNDWLAGDLGNNTIFGGEGLDTFRAGAGNDFVNGWHKGDQVQVASGVTWTTSQVNGDVHITFSNGGEMDLVGVQASSLQSGWIATA